MAVIDGSKALRKALKDLFGQQVLIQRCQVHKMRNVMDYLPKHKCDWVKRKLKIAWTSETAIESDNRQFCKTTENTFELYSRQSI